MKTNPGDVIGDKYRLDRVLGEGGMGTVYAATNIVTGKPVAIKCLRAELSRLEEYPARFLREAQVASCIDHPNVVNVFDVGSHDGALFLVMELLQGEPLSELLIRGRQEPSAFIELMRPVLRGVQAAHRMGVVHRDLKPDNIFLCRSADGEVREPKVLDFGISKISERWLQPERPLTREGAVFGTPQYMAPEQVRNTHCADARSDIYALGVIFYRALSGAYPYDAESLPALALRIVEGKAIPLHERCPELSIGLADVIMRALAPEPEKRFQTVNAFASALELHADRPKRTPVTAYGFGNAYAPQYSEGRPPRSQLHRGPERTPPSGSDGPARASGGLSPTPVKHHRRAGWRVATLMALLALAVIIPLLVSLWRTESSAGAPPPSSRTAPPAPIPKPATTIVEGATVEAQPALDSAHDSAHALEEGKAEQPGAVHTSEPPLVKPQSERPRRTARANSVPEPRTRPPAASAEPVASPVQGTAPLEADPPSSPDPSRDRLQDKDRNPYLRR